MRFHLQNPTVVLRFQRHTTPVCVCVWAGGGVDLGVSSRASAPKYRASVSPTTRRRSHITRRPHHSRPSLFRSHYRLYLASTAWHSELYHVCSVVCLLSVHSPETWNQLAAPEHDLWPLFLSTDMRLLPALSANTEHVCAHICYGVAKASVLITLRRYKHYR